MHMSMDLKRAHLSVFLSQPNWKIDGRTFSKCDVVRNDD